MPLHEFTEDECRRGAAAAAEAKRAKREAAGRLAIERLADKLERAGDVLAEKLDSDDETIQLRAIREVFDRVLGRPAQAIVGETTRPVTFILQSAFAALDDDEGGS